MDTKVTLMEALFSTRHDANYLTRAANIQAALAAAGLVIVPVEPTAEMKAAASRIPHARDEEIYAAMIAARAGIEDAAKMAPDKRHFEILAEAMAEVKATIDGLSDQSISAIVDGCIAEINALPARAFAAKHRKDQADG